MATTKKDKASEPPPASAPGLLFFRDILGQESVLSQLQTAMAQGRLPHAYLFLGPDGVGKASTARALAAALNCTSPRDDGDACGECPSCRRLAAGTHPDFLIIAPEPPKLQIGIEQIRVLRRLTQYPPLGGGWRVALINPATALSVQNEAAANALLKTLEEPPPQHLLVLTARGEADLLPTLVSRCHKLAFAPLPGDVIARELEGRRGLSSSQAELLAALSGGSLGRALALDPDDLLARRRQMLVDFSRLREGSAAVLLDWAQRLAKDRAELDNFLLLAQLWYRDLLLAHFKAPRDLLANKDLSAELAQESAGGAPETWFARLAALGAAARQLQANLNPELTLDVLGLKLAARRLSS
jgi:DNA polymerase III subunit delta'